MGVISTDGNSTFPETASSQSWALALTIISGSTIGGPSPTLQAPSATTACHTPPPSPSIRYSTVSLIPAAYSGRNHCSNVLKDSFTVCTLAPCGVAQFRHHLRSGSPTSFTLRPTNTERRPDVNEPPRPRYHRGGQNGTLISVCGCHKPNPSCLLAQHQLDRKPAKALALFSPRSLHSSESASEQSSLPLSYFLPEKKQATHPDETRGKPQQPRVNITPCSAVWQRCKPSLISKNKVSTCISNQTKSIHGAKSAATVCYVALADGQTGPYSVVQSVRRMLFSFSWICRNH